MRTAAMSLPVTIQSSSGSAKCLLSLTMASQLLNLPISRLSRCPREESGNCPLLTNFSSFRLRLCRNPVLLKTKQDFNLSIFLPVTSAGVLIQWNLSHPVQRQEAYASCPPFLNIHFLLMQCMSSSSTIDKVFWRPSSILLPLTQLCRGFFQVCDTIRHSYL